MVEDDTTPPPTYENTWLVDRSRHEDGIAWCPRARYYRYHSGPSGYGVQLRALNLPRTTGTYLHELERALLVAAAAGTLDTAAAKKILADQVSRYKRVCAERGFTEGLAEDLTAAIEEQAALIEAFGWAMHHYWIPELLEQYTPVLVEQEINLELPQREQSLQPVVVMLRPDLVLEQKLTTGLYQVDFKSVKDPGYRPWRRQWEDNGQLALQGWGAEQVLGRVVDLSYVYALVKGRDFTRKGETLTRTGSALIYSYYKRGNPPMEQDDWKLRYEWVDELGQSRRLGKGYERTATWSHPWPLPAGMSGAEFWVRSLGKDGANAAREVLGPFQSTQLQRESMLRSVVAEEQRWQRKLWAIYDSGEKRGWDEAHPEHQAVLDEEVPRTWQCHKYGKDCQFLRVCTDPQRLAPHLRDDYQLRRPHHEAELAQMVGRGIEPPVAGDGTDEEE